MSEAANRAVALLEALANKLGVTVAYLWPILVARTRFYWWAEMASVTVAVVVMSVLTWRFKVAFEKAGKTAKPDGWGSTRIERDREGICLALSSGLLAVVAVMWLCQLGMMADAVYPEAATVERLLHALAPAH